MSGEELEVLIEVSSWSFRKTSLARDGGFRQEFRSLLPCPFNYGTAPELPSADGEGQDVIVIGPRLRMGSRVRVRPRLRVVFVDRGVPDDKLVARLDGRRLSLVDHAWLRAFFTVYTIFKRLRYALKGGGAGATGVRGYERT